MLKKSLFAVAVVALLAAAVPAGEIKLDQWPVTYVPQTITKIPVLLDVGFWIFVPDQDKLKIKLAQVSQAGGGKHRYEGATNVNVRTNFDIKLSTSIAKVGDWSGGLESSVSPDTVSAGSNTVSVRAVAKDVVLNSGGFIGGAKNVQVATVTLKVVPQ